MLNKVCSFIRQQGLINRGDTVICALSGGADSVALLYALYLLRDRLGIRLEAAHFNHCLRGEESQRDENFVRELCEKLDIPLNISRGEIVPGQKGLENAAREARYAFLCSLPGKIATAHTADDNAETVLMRLIRGTGLRGLGGIPPVNGCVIRPMLTVTRQDVEGFLREHDLPHVEDSTNAGDAFLRNRLRHHVMPLLKQENPRLAENLSTMALRLRLDEDALSQQAGFSQLPPVSRLRQMPPAVRSRVLEQFLRENGVREPEQTHIAQAEALVFSDNPSARITFPGGIAVTRCYDTLEAGEQEKEISPMVLDGVLDLPRLGLRIICTPAQKTLNTPYAFTVCPEGEIIVRSRQAGDKIRLPGGEKSLKKLFIDRKIPANQRNQIPVLEDSRGILGVYGIGANLHRHSGSSPAMTIRFESIPKE